MKKLLVLFSCALALFALGGCYYDVEEQLYGAGSCDTANVTYSVTIRGIIATYNCNSCHDAAAPNGNVILSTYAGVKTVASSGQLLGAITHSPGFSPMPQGFPKMSDCDIRKVKAWVDSGAPQN